MSLSLMRAVLAASLALGVVPISSSVRSVRCSGDLGKRPTPALATDKAKGKRAKRRARGRASAK